MQTPWGKSDSIVKIERGVSWVGTPSHGGLAVSNRAAILSLSMKARTYGTDRQDVESAPYFFFEEDCAYAIAFYEHPEWYRSLEAHTAREYSVMACNNPHYAEYALKHITHSHLSDNQVREEMAEIIQRCFPEYFSR